MNAWQGCSAICFSRQADALIVGGKDFHQSWAHLKEIFGRFRISNMTIKPSKLIIAPASMTLFGWEYTNQVWRLWKYWVNPLQSAKFPCRVKQLRSCLGASTQLSAGLKDYTKIFRPLEQFVVGKAPSDKIIWMEDFQDEGIKSQLTLIIQKTQWW